MDRKHGQSLEPWDTDFTVQLQNELTKTVQKLSNGQTKGGRGGRTIAPPLNTPLRPPTHFVDPKF